MTSSLYSPKALSLMPTWQCTAQCHDCGTLSGPHVRTMLKRDDIISAIETAASESFEAIVFTGGEATLRWPDLLLSIRRAADLGLASRLVTNAWWAVSLDAAAEKMRHLADAGLSEINFSTGDEHARFVPVDSVLRGISASLDAGFSPSLMIEVRGEAQVNRDAICSSDLFKDLIGTRAHALNICESPWMPVDHERIGSYPQGMLANKGNVASKSGCDSIFNTHTLQANGVIGVCCGLGMRLLPELKLGAFAAGETSFQTLQKNAEIDLVKLMIRQVGPERVLERAAAVDPSIKWEDT